MISAAAVLRSAPRIPSSVSKLLPFVLGLLIVAGLWEVIGRFEVFGRGWPALSDVLGHLSDTERSRVIWRALPTTARSAVLGLVLGVIVGVSIALTGVMIRPLRDGIARMVTAIRAIPIIAFAPMLIVTVGRDLAPVYSAMIISIYPVWVALSAALLNAPEALAQLSIALGAKRSRAVRVVFLPNALPGMVDGVRLAAPVAIIGAIIGEWFGAERGLGIVIVASVLNNQILQLWAAAMLGAALSLVTYGLLSALHRIIVRSRAI